MKASSEIRKWMNKLRSRHAGKNGVIGSWFLDIVEMDRKAANDRKRALRKNGKFCK